MSTVDGTGQRLVSGGRSITAMTLLPADGTSPASVPVAASRSLRLLPYPICLLALGGLGQQGLFGVAAAHAGSRASLSTVDFVALSIGPTIITVAALAVLAVITAWRRNRFAYRFVVGLLAFNSLCFCANTYVSPFRTGARSELDLPAWSGPASVASVICLAIGFVASVVILALPATRRSLLPPQPPAGWPV
jgi:hypothetical protein